MAYVSHGSACMLTVHQILHLLTFAIAVMFTFANAFVFTSAIAFVFTYAKVTLGRSF